MIDRRTSLIYMLIASVFVLTGCISIPDSQSPRFYGLSVVDESQVGEKFDVPADIVIAISQTQIPGYLDRPQIVTEGEDHKLHFAQFDRWAEPLNLAVTRVVRENLTQLMTRAIIVNYPLDFSYPLSYRVELEITRFQVDLLKEVVLSIQWTVVDMQDSKNTVIKRSDFRLPNETYDYPGVAKALSAACALLSNEIGKVVFEIEAKR